MADVAKDYYKKYWKLGMEDPDVFVSKILSPAHWRNPITGVEEEMRPNAPQSKWLHSSWHPYNVWAAGNSGGKSFGSAFKACYCANYKIKPGKTYKSYDEFLQQPYKILLTGPESKQAMALFEQVEFLLTHSPYMAQKVVNITMGTKKDPHSRIELDNGVSIHAISTKNKGKHIESGDYDIIIFDEPEDEPHLEYVIDKVLVPRMFRRGGILDMVGTPKDSPHYFDQYRKGAGPEDEYYDPRYYEPELYWSMNSSSFENPFADQDKISQYTKKKDASIIRERLQGKFETFSDSAFPEAAINKCLDPDMPIHILPSSDRKYITGVDFGRKNDYTVAITIDVTELPWTVVHFGRWGGGNVSWEFIFNQLYNIFTEYGSEFYIDATSAGGDMQAEYLNQLGIFYAEYIYTPAKKVALLNNLQDCMARGKIRFGYIPELKEELRYYPSNFDDKQYDTDCVMSLALACLRAKIYADPAEPYTY